MFSNKSFIKNQSLSKSAVTLTELMVTTIIIALTVALLHTSFSAGNITSRVYDSKVTTQREARRAMASMIRELRGATNPAAISDGISFDYGGNQVTYTTKANQLIRTEGGVESIIANYISAISFDIDPISASWITINLTSSKALTLGETEGNVKPSITLKKKVSLRS